MRTSSTPPGEVHADDPVFGYRFIADELAAEHGIRASENRVHRLCSAHGIFSVLARKKGRRPKPGEPVHDDLVRRAFGAKAPNDLWFTDITEHGTAEGKLYLCAVKDAFSGRIVGYSPWTPGSGLSVPFTLVRRRIGVSAPCRLSEGRSDEGVLLPVGVATHEVRGQRRE